MITTINLNALKPSTLGILYKATKESLKDDLNPELVFLLDDLAKAGLINCGDDFHEYAGEFVVSVL